MSKFCTNCGKEMDDGANVCSICGTILNGANIQKMNRPVTIRNREVVTCVILSILTCGIYGIYWFICLTDDSNSVSNSEKTASGGISFLLSLVTCGIYTIYWNYKLGKKLYEAGKLHAVDIPDNSVIYLILSILGLGIVSYCLAQSDLNKIANR